MKEGVAVSLAAADTLHWWFGLCFPKPQHTMQPTQVLGLPAVVTPKHLRQTHGFPSAPWPHCPPWPSLAPQSRARPLLGRRRSHTPGRSAEAGGPTGFGQGIWPGAKRANRLLVLGGAVQGRGVLGSARGEGTGGGAGGAGTGAEPRTHNRPWHGNVEQVSHSG